MRARPIPPILLLVLAGLAGLHPGCGGGGGYSSSSTSPPSITGFTAAAPKILKGGSTTLTAVFNYGSGSITPGGIAVTSGTPVTVSPTATTVFTLTVSGTGTAATATASVGVQGFTATGSMASARLSPTATLLPNGKVLVAGGGGAADLTSAELYDPAAGTFSATGSMAQARSRHAAVLMANGKVLMIGGTGANGVCEVYDPASGAFTATGSMGVNRYNVTAIALDDGRVLVAGGTGSVIDAQIYTPSTGTWSAPINMGTSQYFTDLVKLGDGRIMVCGPTAIGPAIFNPVTNGFTPSARLVQSHTFGRAVLLADGRVWLSAGGGTALPYNFTEAYVAGTDAWTASTPLLLGARTLHGQEKLASGKVLVLGGSNVASLATAEVFDPVANVVSATAPMNSARTNPTSVRLANGKVLVLGGTLDPNSNVGGLASAELFDPGD